MQHPQSRPALEGMAERFAIDGNVPQAHQFTDFRHPTGKASLEGLGVQLVENALRVCSKRGDFCIMEYEPQTLSFRPDGRPMGRPRTLEPPTPAQPSAAHDQYDTGRAHRLL